MADLSVKPHLLFPCDYLIKIIGVANEEFELSVIPILNKHIPTLTEGSIVYKKSRSDKYVSLTINFYAKSKEQVDELYRALSTNSQVLMAL